MADREPIDQADPGQPIVTAPTILNGARRNTSLDTIAGSRICVSPCQCPIGRTRACTPNHDPDAECPEVYAEDREQFEFLGFDWHALDMDEIGLCDDGDMVASLREIARDGAAFMLGQELDSSPYTGNPSLQSEAIDIAPGVAAHPADATAMLMHAASKVGQYRSTFIAPAHAEPALSPMLTRSNGQTRLLGRPIIFSPGVSGFGPGGVDPGPGVAYIYLLKGAVDYNLNEVNWSDYDMSATVTDERLNRIYAQAMMQGIVRFNPACVHAVAVCLKHESCCSGTGEAMELAAELEAEAAKAEADRIAALEAEAAAKAKAEAAAKLAAETAEADRIAAEIAAQEQAKLDAEREAAQAERIALQAMAGTAADETLPDGTITEVLEWVDGNADRAFEALEAELDGRNRSTLTSELEQIIEG